MRVFVAGATGAIGSRLIPQLVDRGHEVIGSSRSPDKAEQIRALGAEPVALDLLDREAVRRVVVEAAPDAIVHQATALADVNFSRNFDRIFASYRNAREGGPVKTEDDRLDPSPPASTRESSAAMRHLEEAVTTAGGIVLRYGLFYGAANDGLIEPVRKRQYPIVGEGGGITSFIHLDDAAAATVLALDHDGPGIFNVVDDEPAPVREWLPVYAEALGAGPPRRFPRWLARLFAGEAAVVTGTEARGASNAKAKRELGWEPRYASWREGFAAAYATPVPAERRKPQRAAGGRLSESR